MDDERMYTVAQVAERLQASPATLRAWLRTGQLHGVRMGGTKLGWRIPASEVERLARGELIECGYCGACSLASRA